MRWVLLLSTLLVLPLFSVAARAQTAEPSADQIIQKVLESDPWGLSRGQIKASAVLTDKRGTKRELAFVAASKRHDPPLSKSLVRFSSPPDLAGAGFLQVQNRNRDDDRYLFLPALKRSRRISGNSRSGAFMGTDFSFADLDRRDLRDGQARRIGTEKIGSADCYIIDVVPLRRDSQYSHLELWIRPDTFLTLRAKMYDKANVQVKQFEARELRKVGNSWFVAKSLMKDLKHQHTTLLTLESIIVDIEIPDEDFTVRALERP